MIKHIALFVLVVGCEYTATCPSPADVGQVIDWDDSVPEHTCGTPVYFEMQSNGHGRYWPKGDECTQIGYRNDNNCQQTQQYICSNRIELIISVESDTMTGNFLIRDMDSHCETRFTWDGALR